MGRPNEPRSFADALGSSSHSNDITQYVSQPRKRVRPTFAICTLVRYCVVQGSTLARYVAANRAQDFTTVDADIPEVAVAHRQKLSHRSPLPVPSRIGRPPALERSHHRSAHGLRGSAVQQRRCAQDCFHNDHFTGNFTGSPRSRHSVISSKKTSTSAADPPSDLHPSRRRSGFRPAAQNDQSILVREATTLYVKCQEPPGA